MIDSVRSMAIPTIPGVRAVRAYSQAACPTKAHEHRDSSPRVSLPIGPPEFAPSQPATLMLCFNDGVLENRDLLTSLADHGNAFPLPVPPADHHVGQHQRAG